MRINGKIVPTCVKNFAFDGCHKIYLCKSSEEEQEAVANGYELFPIDRLPSVYASGCRLRFISTWDLAESFVDQSEDAKFSEFLPLSSTDLQESPHSV